LNKQNSYVELKNNSHLSTFITKKIGDLKVKKLKKTKRKGRTLGKANMIEAYLWKARPSQNLKNSTIFKVESKLRMLEVMTSRIIGCYMIE
jgi:hypothetical protein